MQKYRDRYDISEKYSDWEARIIAGIRYEMEKRNFSSNNPYVFATDVDIDTITTIKEQRDKYFCVTDAFISVQKQFCKGLCGKHRNQKHRQ